MVGSLCAMGFAHWNVNGRFTCCTRQVSRYWHVGRVSCLGDLSDVSICTGRGNGCSWNIFGFVFRSLLDRNAWLWNRRLHLPKMHPWNKLERRRYQKNLQLKILEAYSIECYSRMWSMIYKSITRKLPACLPSTTPRGDKATLPSACKRESTFETS